MSLEESITALAGELRRISEGNAAACIDAMTAVLKNISFDEKEAEIKECAESLILKGEW
jgi:hypothetical protein